MLHFVPWLVYLIDSSKVMKVGGKQNSYEMWQARISLAASPLAKSLAGFAREEYGGSAATRPAHESRQLRRLELLTISRVLGDMMPTKVISRINWTPSRQIYNHNSQLSHDHLPSDSRNCNRLMTSLSRQWREETSSFSSVEPHSQRVNHTVMKFSCMLGMYIWFGSPCVVHCSWVYDV